MVLSEIRVLNLDLVALLWRYRGSNLRSKVLPPWGNSVSGTGMAQSKSQNKKTRNTIVYNEVVGDQS